MISLLVKMVNILQIKVQYQMALMIFFVNVGPNLANTIKVPEGTAQDVYSFMCDPIDKSMFVEPIFEQEIISIVKNGKS